MKEYINNKNIRDNTLVRNRQANFELLRIVSMILIIIFHFSDWGGLMNISEPISNKLFGQFINIGGKLGVNIFVLISGYFLVNSKFKFKKLLKIIFEVWTYSVGISIICCILNIGDLSLKNILKSFAPISYNMYWFATTYIGMYLIFPIINKLINSIDKHKHKIILILLGIMLSIIPTFIIKSSPFNSNLSWFIYIYMIAAYIKKYGIKFMNNNIKNLVIIISIVLFMFIISLICTVVGEKVKVLNKFANYFNVMNSLPMLILSVYIFMFFKNINIKDNKIITIFARSSFAVYLIHINTILRVYLFNDIIKIQNFYKVNTLILILYVMLSTIAIYLICTIIDIIRIKIIEKPLFNIKKFDKYIDKVDEMMNF